VAARDPQSARAIAAQVLHGFDPAREYAGRKLDPLLDRTQERQRATDLVLGTIRNRGAIDAVIAKFSGRPVARIDAKLLSILRIAVYEIAYHPATPVYSIVDEAVNSVGKSGGKRQSGFVNAVLRQIVRHVANRQADLAQASPSCTLVQTPQAGCEFDAAFLPDPSKDAVTHLSLRFSLPSWLVAEWMKEFGPERTLDICMACNRRPSLYVRVNPLRTTHEDLLAKFQETEVQAESVRSDAERRYRTADIMPVNLPEDHGPCPGGSGKRQFADGSFPIESEPSVSSEDSAYRCHPDRAIVSPVSSRAPNEQKTTAASAMIRISGPHAVTQLPGFSEGLFSVQDLSASQAVQILAPQPGWSILDLCSAPGSKTTQIAELSQDAAKIAATDIDPVRLARVTENAARLGLASVAIVPHAQIEQRTEPFDAVLIDAPCSNTGVLARRVEARFRVTAQAVKDIAAIQKGLLAKAAGLVKPGGRLCYSTCSIQRRENQDMIRDFLSGHTDFELADESLLLPTTGEFDHDGGYVALLVRK
jgi:16S rRNA (cytosine(967)-C(5))-methyltransferase